MTAHDPKTVLVVDDEADIRNFLKAALLEAKIIVDPCNARASCCQVGVER